MSFGLDIHTGSGHDLQHGGLEARRIRNEINRLDKHGWDWSDIKSAVVDSADHVKNTSQLIIDKALGELDTDHDHKDDNWGRPCPYIDRSYPMVMTHGEGYRLFTDSDRVRFRITATRGTHVKGELRGSADIMNAYKLHSKTTTGGSALLKSSTNTASGGLMSPSRTNTPKSLTNTIQRRLWVWM